MRTILQINASLFSGEGQSSRLADEYVARLAERIPDLRVIKRDLAKEPVPHLDAERFGAFSAKPQARTPRQLAIVAYSDALIDELREANEIVIGLPMYNFGVPSQFKAWIDHVARAGETFRYTAEGALGLLTQKKVTLFAARGGRYEGMPSDTQSAYVRNVFAFIGITDLTFVYAEGLAIDASSRQASIEQARVRIEHLASPLRIAA